MFLPVLVLLEDEAVGGIGVTGRYARACLLDCPLQITLVATDAEQGAFCRQGLEQLCRHDPFRTILVRLVGQLDRDRALPEDLWHLIGRDVVAIVHEAPLGESPVKPGRRTRRYGIYPG